MIPSRLSPQNIESALQNAITSDWLTSSDTSAVFIDIGFLIQRLDYLSSCFPKDTLHSLAIKANPLTRLLKIISYEFPAIGIEAASIGEVHQGLNCGFCANQIVYDSPVKTVDELTAAIMEGVHINADNLTEIERIEDILKQLPNEYSETASAGLRINPQVGVGTILESSVAGIYSKFGVPISSGKEEILRVFAKFAWLRGVHLHVGSQGCDPSMLVRGTRVLYDLLIDIQNERQKKGLNPVSVFDIGGGLPVSYHSGMQAPDMKDYANALKYEMPGLFDMSGNQRYRLITEFGRWVFTNPGWTVSRVEYVKHDPGINTAMIHVGADLFVRECLNPTDWQHEYSVFDSSGKLKTGLDSTPWNLAGPLCFSGDILAKNLRLPAIDEGDLLVIHDTGSYTFSMWSRYNSRQLPRILGYRGEKFTILKERESVEETLGFWE